MGRETSGRTLSSEPSTPTAQHASGHSSPVNIDHGHDLCNPEESNDLMIGSDVQDNINLQAAASVGVTRDAMLHEPSTNDPQDDDRNIHDGMSAPPVVAHLASDEADIDAILEERWAARIAQGMEERTGQVTDRVDTILVVADEVKDVQTNPGQKRQLQWIMAIMLLLLVVVVVVGVSVVFVTRGNDNKQVMGTEASSPPSDAPSGDQSASPSFSPVPVDPLVEEMRSWIAPNREDLMKFLDPASPQSQALVWLQNDTITLTPGRSTRTVLERYVLAVLYYSTSGPSWGFDYLSDNDVCTWNNGKLATDYSAPCLWDYSCEFLEGEGMYCVEGGETIGTLVLYNTNLRGPLPWELALLTNLEAIDVGYNSLTGSIPTQIMNLTGLRALVILLNSFSGSIPSEITALTKLEVISASQSGLTGTLPATFSPFTFHIDLYINSFEGTIPDSWWTTMPALERVILSWNMLTGSLPSSLGHLSNLTELFIFSNILTGPLPTTFPASAVYIFLEENAFTGSIAITWVGNMPSLFRLSLHTNSLTGTIPPSLSLD